MKDKLLKFLESDFCYILIMFCVFMILQKHCVVMMNSDDEIFMVGLQNNGLFLWMKEFYLNWSGRIFITGLDGIFLNLNIWIFKIANSFMFSFLCHNISNLTESKKLFSKLTISFLTLSIYSVTLSSSVIWITGSFNYLWPTSCALYILRCCKKILYGSSLSGQELVMGCILSFIGCNNEQCASIILVFLLISMIYSNFVYKKNHSRNFILLGFVFLNFLILMLAPGNYSRTEFEMLKWFNTFDSITIYDKVIMGLYSVSNYLFNYANNYLVLLFLIVLAKIMIEKMNIGLIIIGFSNLLYVIGNIILKMLHIRYPFEAWIYNIYYYLYNFESYSPSSFSNFISGLSIILASVVLISELYLIQKVVISTEKNIFVSLLYLGGIMSVIVLGFSPTLASSGMRIYFTLTILFICVIIELINSLDRMKFCIYLVVVAIFLHPLIQNISTFLLDNNYLSKF